ncbi:hypothetical protein TNCV_1133181 [Trichonephila clavipes]|nr:hypothetical protein TNCV_1133181 [Trichonephila clavipes]
MGSEIIRQMRDGIWKCVWEIVNPDDPDQENGTKLRNCCIVIVVMDRTRNSGLVGHKLVTVTTRLPWLHGYPRYTPTNGFTITCDGFIAYHVRLSHWSLRLISLRRYEVKPLKGDPLNVQEERSQ